MTSVLIYALPILCLADEKSKNDTVKTLSSSPISSNALFETVLGLGLILALIFVLAWLIKRTGKFQTTANGEIKMIATLSLGPRERAILLEVGGARILVGVTTQQIRTLHVLGQDDTPEKSDKYGQFDQQLQSIIQKEQSND
jgi:flagellar protein FliO/FliZ